MEFREILVRHLGELVLANLELSHRVHQLSEQAQDRQKPVSDGGEK